MGKSVVTLGTFDGVHRGHLALLQKVVMRARLRRAVAAALVFDMPPRHAGEPLAKPVLLSTLDEKRRRLREEGIARIEVLRFDRKLASTLPEDFFRQTIVGKLRACEMVVGPKVAFGKNRSGRLSQLMEYGKKYHVLVHVAPAIGRGDHEVSSRRIRRLLGDGRVEEAQRLLGRPYDVEGRVVHGERRGRTLGFPTANLDVPSAKILPPGVFAVYASVIGSQAKVSRLRINALCNVGHRPTFYSSKTKRTCEVYFLNPVKRLYGQRLQVHFLRKLRTEKRFPSPQALQSQIARDVARAQLYRKTHFSI